MAHNVGPVQVALAGLYGMLGVKDGSNPDIITGFVQPVLDAVPWWLRATQEALTTRTVLNMTGAVVSSLRATVPSNEWWFIAQATAFLQLDIATIARGYFVQWQILEPLLPSIWWQSPPLPALLDSGGGALYQQGPGVSNPAATIEGLWVPPGSRIFVNAQGNAGNPDTLTISSLYGSRARI